MEPVRSARAIIDVLSPTVAGYDTDRYVADVTDAVHAYCPSVPHFVIWRHCDGSLTTFERLQAEYGARYAEIGPPLKLAEGIGPELQQLSRTFDVVLAGQYRKEILDTLNDAGLLGCFANHLAPACGPASPGRTCQRSVACQY